MSPQRIQRKRSTGWRMPEGAIYVGRPSKWGNPWVVGRDYSVADVVVRFIKHLNVMRAPWPGWVDLVGYPSLDEIRAELAGKDLACWCPIGQPCHADELLRIAAAPVDPQHPGNAVTLPAPDLGGTA